MSGSCPADDGVAAGVSWQACGLLEDDVLSVTLSGNRCAVCCGRVVLLTVWRT